MQDQTERADAAREAFGLVAALFGNEKRHLGGNAKGREMTIAPGEAHRIRLTGANFTFLMLQSEFSLLSEQLREHNPRLLEALRPGLGPHELHEWERQHGAYLPQDLFDLFCWHDGTDLTGLEPPDLPMWGSNSDCLMFTDTEFFVPFKEAQVASNMARIAHAYEKAGLVPEQEIVLFLKPFVSFDYYALRDEDCLLVPCTRTRQPSLPLFMNASRFDELCFGRGSIEAMLRIAHRSYEEGLMVFESDGRKWMSPDLAIARENSRQEIQLSLECDPLIEKLNARLFGL